MKFECNEKMKRVISHLYKWIDDSCMVALYPMGHIMHENGHGDAPHHTGRLMIAVIFNGCKLPGWFKKGIQKRWKVDKNKNLIEFRRHPRIDTPMNRDQLTPLIFPMVEAGMEDKARILIKKYAGWLFPHQWMHFQRSLNVKHMYIIRLFCDLFECFDSLTDWLSGSESSQIKNIDRLIIASVRYPTFLIGVAKYLFRLGVNVLEVNKEYHTREPWDKQAPIHEAYVPIIREYIL